MTTDQSPPVSRAFMSRLREVLTARLPQGPGWVVWVDGVVEELADVTPAQGIDLADFDIDWGSELDPPDLTHTLCGRHITTTRWISDHRDPTLRDYVDLAASHACPKVSS